jgi:hypothetical protein
MIWGNIIKAIPFLFQVILVVAAVLLFAFLDPFGIFIQTKRTLKDTPVDVESIREIGQLITAEYYGEVVSSYAHEIQEEQDTTLEIFRANSHEMLERYVLEINRLHDQFTEGEFKKSKIEEKARQALNADLFQTAEFSKLLHYIDQYPDYSANDIDKELSDFKTQRLIRDAVINGYDNKPIAKTEEYLSKFITINTKVFEKENVKKLKRKNLVLLGRGWVKAGFDFGQFSERNFRYDADRKNIYFIGFQPQILSATINPWFIPERGVEGFEFLIVERKARRDYKEVQIVKHRCLDELVRKAHEREILKLAIENARENLKEFFSLIIGEQINNVVMFDNELEYTYAEIAKNDTITGEELILIDYLLEKDEFQGVTAGNILRAKVSFVNNLRHSKAKIAVFDRISITDQWEPNLALAYMVAKDGIYDEISDSTLIHAYSERYCEYSMQGYDSLNFVCNSSMSVMIADNVNIFIGRTTEVMDLMKENFDADNLDTLYAEDKIEVRGFSVTKSSQPSIFNDFVLNQTKSACSCGK